VALIADVSIQDHGAGLGPSTIQSGTAPAEAIAWITDNDLTVGRYGPDVMTELADLNGDGAMDAVITDTHGQIWTRLGDGNGDVFVFANLNDSTTQSMDVIENFDTNADKIDFSALDISYNTLALDYDDGFVDVRIANEDFLIRLVNTDANLSELNFIF